MQTSSIGIIAGAVKSLNEKQGNVVARFGLKLLFGYNISKFLISNNRWLIILIDLYNIKGMVIVMRMVDIIAKT